MKPLSNEVLHRSEEFLKLSIYLYDESGGLGPVCVSDIVFLICYN